MAKDGPDDFKAAKRAKIKVPIEAEFERRAALPSSGSHYVRWEESVVELGGGFNPLGWAIPIIFCLAAFGGSLGAEGSLSLVADCGFGRSSCGSTSATFPFPQTPERNPVLEEVSGANHHIIGLRHSLFF